MSTDPLTHIPRKRLGGRTADVTRRIHKAVIALLREGGHEACTFRQVAKRAGIERSTLYRRYVNRWAMLGEAFAAHYVDDLAFKPTGSLRGDLQAHLQRVARTLGSPLGGAMLVAAAVARLDPASREAAGKFWYARRQQQRGLVEAAIARGELEPDVRLDELFAAADGPLYFRLLIIGAPIDQEWIRATVDQVCRAFAPRRAGVLSDQGETAS